MRINCVKVTKDEVGSPQHSKRNKDRTEKCSPHFINYSVLNCPRTEILILVGKTLLASMLFSDGMCFTLWRMCFILWMMFWLESIIKSTKWITPHWFRRVWIEWGESGTECASHSWETITTTLRTVAGAYEQAGFRVIGTSFHVCLWGIRETQFHY